MNMLIKQVGKELVYNSCLTISRKEDVERIVGCFNQTWILPERIVLITLKDEDSKRVNFYLNDIAVLGNAIFYSSECTDIGVMDMSDRQIEFLMDMFEIYADVEEFKEVDYDKF